MAPGRLCIDGVDRFAALLVGNGGRATREGWREAFKNWRLFTFGIMGAIAHLAVKALRACMLAIICLSQPFCQQDIDPTALIE